MYSSYASERPVVFGIAAELLLQSRGLLTFLRRRPRRPHDRSLEDESASPVIVTDERDRRDVLSG